VGVARVLLFIVTLLFLCVAGLAITQNGMGMRRNQNEPLPTLELIVGKGEQVLRGAELYDWNCAVCHGPTALGFEEAKTAFPETHHDCDSCHRRNNPKTRASMQGNDNERETFSIGEAPDLRTAGTLEKFPSAGVLYAYIQSAMPRYEPGRLSRQETLDITAFLLALHDLTLEQELTEANVMQTVLEPQ
jgi:cytochrome c